MADLKNAENEEIEQDQLEEDSEILPEEEQENKSLSIKEKLILLLLGISAFLLSFLMLFPIEEIVRFMIGRVSHEAGFVLDFKKLDFPIFGKKSFDAVYFLNKDGIEFKSEELLADVGIKQLYSAKLDGEVQASPFEIDTHDLTITGSSLKSKVNLSNIDEGFSAVSGSVEILMNASKITRFPVIPFVGDLSGTQIKTLNITVRKNGAILNLEKALLHLSIAKIRVKGSINLSPVFKNSQLNLEVCPELDKKYAAERSDIANGLELLKKGPEGCFPLQGTISDPKVNLGGGGQSSNSISSPPTTVNPPAGAGNPPQTNTGSANISPPSSTGTQTSTAVQPPPANSAVPAKQ